MYELCLRLGELGLLFLASELPLPHEPQQLQQHRLTDWHRIRATPHRKHTARDPAAMPASSPTLRNPSPCDPAELGPTATATVGSCEGFLSPNRR